MDGEVLSETALELLHGLQAIERAMGRPTQRPVWSPRCIDLDILLYEDLTVAEENLTIPHPRMHKRRFVLQPLCDINPTLIHPVLDVDMQSLLNALDDEEQRIQPYG